MKTNFNSPDTLDGKVTPTFRRTSFAMGCCILDPYGN